MEIQRIHALEPTGCSNVDAYFPVFLAVPNVTLDSIRGSCLVCQESTSAIRSSARHLDNQFRSSPVKNSRYTTRTTTQTTTQ